MASEIKVNKITGKGATGGADAPLQFNGNVLTATIADATITTGTFPAGHVIQVVSNSPDLAQTSTASTSYISSGLSQAITPSATSSKIFITISINVNVQNTAGCMLTIYRDSTNLAPGGNNSSHGFARLYTNSGGDSWGDAALQFLDSPSTISAITYACYYKAEAGTAALYAGGWTAPTITLMEIAG